MTDVFEVLGTAHREVEQMLDRMQAMMDAPVELRAQGRALADTLISAVSQHEAAEEAYFWPTVKKKVSDGDSLAAGGIEQETEGKKVLAELDGMAPDDPQFIPLMTKFAHAARAHIAYEEQQVWPSFRAALPADEAYGLGAKLANAIQAAPTRPHPHTPPSPALLKATGPSSRPPTSSATPRRGATTSTPAAGHRELLPMSHFAAVASPPIEVGGAWPVVDG